MCQPYKDITTKLYPHHVIVYIYCVAQSKITLIVTSWNWYAFNVTIFLILHLFIFLLFWFHNQFSWQWNDYNSKMVFHQRFSVYYFQEQRFSNKIIQFRYQLFSRIYITAVCFIWLLQQEYHHHKIQLTGNTISVSIEH